MGDVHAHGQRGLLVVSGRIELKPCALYKGHLSAVVEQHHICPKSWWEAKGVPVASPMITICGNCHGDAHAAIDGILAGRDVSAIPPRCVSLAREGLAIAAQHGLTPAPTL
jgi:hypothetical protein